MALRPDIFQRNSLSGTVTTRNGFANVNVDIGPYGLTGNINFIVQLRRGSIAGSVIAATPPINLVDYSELISFAPNVAIISEGEDVRFDLLTANVPDGSTFYYTANAVSGNVDAEDFISQITGSVIVYDNQANILISSNSVPTTAVETGEVFNIQLRLGSTAGEVTRTSNVVEILDTANIVDVTALSLSSNVIFESESVVFTIDTVNALGTNSQVLYYTVTGNADIYTGQSGSFLVSGNQANLELIADASVNQGEVRTLAVEIRRGSTAGQILQTSDTIYVQDAIVGVVATGGNVTTSGDYTTHSFNVSSSLNITRSGEANILVVGGGGGGGSSNPTGWQSGGGGAGGLVHATDYRLPADTYTISVGGGGAGDQNGTDTTFISPVIELRGLGGGRGGNGGFGGYPGGSGGGGAHNNAGYGSALQANSIGDSGVYGYGNPGAPGGPSSGGGGGGAGTAGIGGNGPGGNGLPVVMLTEGQNDYYAGGGGGGGAAGGLGGGGQGPGPAGAGKVNSGGGGGSSGYNPGNPGGPGGSGVVLVKYRTSSTFTPKIPLVTDVINITSGDIFYNSNVTFNIQTTNVTSDETFYYKILNAANVNVVGGNTKPFVVQTGNTSTDITIELSLPNEFANISMQVRKDPAGPVLKESADVSISVLPAIGGTVIDDGTYITHVFTTSSNLIISPFYNLTSNVLMVGGGGGGERSGSPGPIQGAGGGGGAGGLILREGTANAIVLYSGNTYPIVIGAGGGQATKGGNTTAFTMISLGGGQGLANGPRNPALNAGGSGGGAGYQSFGNPAAPIAGGPGIQTTSLGIPADSRLYGFGNPGGISVDNSSSNGGGGGAGAAGARPPGGNGLPIQWIPEAYGTPGPAPGRWFAGGGASTSGTGGAGGGGSLSPGVENTGGGGGGGTASSPNNPGRPGGSGIVVIRYPKP